MIAPTHKPIIDYFEYLNLKLKDFPEKSFFRMDHEEIFGAFRSGINFPAMTVESPEGSAEGSGVTNSVVDRVFAFTVYMNPAMGDFEEQNIMLDQCEIIVKKILSRMKYDSTVEGHLLKDRFDVNTANWLKVGPLFSEQLYGYRCTGVIQGHEPLIIDAADWDDIDLICS